MPPDKIKLSPESKRTLLELGLKRIINKQKSVSDEQKKSLMFKFVKMLCVSSSYLNCSRDTYLDIYRLSLRFTQNFDKIRIMLTSKCYEFFDSRNDVLLAYDSVRKLIKLLLPSHLGVSFYDIVTDTNFERCSELLNFTKDTNGKIGFKLLSNNQFLQRLLKAFSTRIHEVFCPMTQLGATVFLEVPVFDRLVVHSIRNSVEVSQILRYKAKELGFYSSFQSFKIDDNNLDDLKNKTVEKLKLDFSSVNCVKIKKLVEQLHKSCFNLKHLVIEAEFFHTYEFSNNEVYGQVVAYVNCIEELKARFGNSLASMHIKFKIEIEVFGQRDNTWIKAIIGKSEFKHWNFESYEKNLDDFEYNGKLKMIFDDAVYHYELTIDVTTYDGELEFEDYDE